MAPQDSYIEEEDETCPLCIEEFDLSDRNFRPCPCGYQICQFCFNNIKNNMNSLCPACRRPYDEKTIQWKVVTQEEIAEFRANIQRSQKKRAAEQRQKEVQKREAEKENRKNLVGVRVVQKNLVYVTGLTPTVREDELLKTLRRPEFFGQYGNIQKISISNRKSSDGQNQSLGIYVTFEKKEDAARCIQAVNGSQNGDRILRAQLGTTKYCSAWLRHEQCTNRQCMFLHELGDEEDSYTRQDLSSMNSISTQRPLANQGSSRSASRQQVHPSPAPSAAQPMVRSSSKEGSENDDGPALPSSATWARNPQVRSRRGSHATSGAAPSPAISSALPVTAESAQEAVEEAVVEEPTPAPAPVVESTPAPEPTSAPAQTIQPAPTTEDELKDLLRSLNKCKIMWPKVIDDETLDASFPPLFDVRGGVKRRAMLDKEATTSVGMDQEEVADVREPSEGEPESAGSLALGGEPEDRDHGRDGHGFDLRRAAQPPIQRATSTNDGPFGPALGSAFGQAASNLGSIGSRTVTPQQPTFMRPPQAAFVDHLPPGIAPQANLFQGQGQGHNRQGSRFSFANDGRDAASSTSVKLAANPRIMAQQSSMMPTAFHNQPGSQYYASSMPGPPPGLKSTGTPPNMFGQHGFGSAFSGVSKDTNDIMQLLRGRGAGNQAHDAGKREYHISSFPNQYPPSTSSTPAPASSLLASLYGSQPGAFQDFGSKQKKKGKRHRHANTSSSGGSGLVDLADPSILQARMQHQQHQQSNAGVGQGLYSGQTQDDDLLSLEAVTTSVDALVSDEPLDNTIRPPPPGVLGTLGSAVARPVVAVPPGLGLPQGHASPAISHSSLSGSLSGAPLGRQTPPVALPIRPFSKPDPAPSSPLAAKSSLLTSKKAAAAAAAPPGLEAKRNIKALAIESGLSKDIAKANSRSQKGLQEKALQNEEFPALGTPKPTPASVTTPTISTKALATKATPATTKKTVERAAVEKTVEKEKPAPSPAKSTATPKKAESTRADKKPVPGILNIAAASKAAQIKTVEASSTGMEKPSDRDNFPALPTPTTASVSSPVTRTGPKMLRLVGTPKTEAPPTPSGGAPVFPGPAARSAAAAAIRPETPASEIISDSASIISASISASRTNSPPPSKIGSAPVRNTTKSQQRKQRKETTKKESATIAAQPVKVEPEVEIAPIIGRKKKQKKEKEKPSGSSGNATPTASRPETPVALQATASSASLPPVKEVKEKEAKDAAKEPAKDESSTYRSTAMETTSLTEVVSPTKVEAKGKGVEDKPEKSDGHSGSASKPLPTPASVLLELQKAGLVPKNLDDLAFFKSTNCSYDKQRLEVAAGPNMSVIRDTMAPSKAVVTDEDQASLLAGSAIHKILDGVRILLTPNGDCIRNLQPHEEERFLELQRHIAEAASSPAAFISSRHETGSGGGFTLIKGRAVPNGPPSYFPQSPGAYPLDPISKIQRDEAIYYINQYVIPRLTVGAKEGKNPLGGAVWSNDKLVDPNPPKMPAAAAAANHLSSLAPWMYGGGGGVAGQDTVDIAAPELSYPGSMESLADVHPHAGLAPYLNLPLMAGAGHGGNGPQVSAEDTGGAGVGVAAGGVGLGTPSPFANVPLMTLEDAEQALSLARREAEKLEKSFTSMVKKNKRLLTITGGH
ncbi:general negative regulator of transcription subunit 4 [Diplogelasinospora grovesii]|uniref:General negative regulator of transcription subunit 4 n=1 Tax=Diplogelasinospora grovesii TaxID=303347 RepID=A0AAN6N617_9PEZI|nr:general negative regulator of transcription subunit 4 [Diplogelasinospora grovesii]